MLYVSSLTVTSYDYNQATLAWTYTDPNASTTGTHVEVYRSETPEPVTAYSGVALDVSSTALSYTDTTISGLNSYQYHTWYYRIKIVNESDILVYDWSAPELIHFDPDSQAKKMIRYKKIGIKKYGTLVKILKKRTEQGEQCDCFDPVLGRTTDDDCLLCHGTGIKTSGGYYDPIEVRAAINTRPKQNQITPFGLWQDNDALMDIMNYPVLAPDDIVIDQQNKRYKIKQISAYDKAQSLISQRCVITLQDVSNPIYDVVI